MAQRLAVGNSPVAQPPRREECGAARPGGALGLVRAPDPVRGSTQDSQGPEAELVVSAAVAIPVAWQPFKLAVSLMGPVLRGP